MLDRIRPRLTYSNVMVTALMFIVLGGGAYAAHSHKIGTKELRNGAVTKKKLAGNAVATAKLRNGAVSAAKIRAGAVGSAALAAGAVGTAAIADGAVTGAKVDESTLGQVPSAQHAADADQLGGIGSDGFIQGSGSTFSHTGSDTPGNGHFFSIPGIGEVLTGCASGGETGMFFQNDSGVGLLAWGIMSRDTGSGAETSIVSTTLVPTQELDLLGPSGTATAHFKYMVRPADASSSMPAVTVEAVVEETASGCEWLTTVTVVG